jgi:16S rRNA (cytosine1402-N4)-methyltransferase
MEHLAVLYEESLQALDIKVDGVYMDCTFGRGGHSRGILDRLGQNGRLLAFDRDPDAIKSGVAYEMRQDARFSLHWIWVFHHHSWIIRNGASVF